jgi:probable F420-dependent oxidoreductase
LKFGVRLPNSGPLANRENIVTVALESDKLGFHSVWVHDHIIWGTEQHKTHLSAGSAEALEDLQRPNFYESITTLSYIAGMTRRVQLGIAVLVLPLRNPLVVAKEIANLDVLSEGRVIVGVAPGAPNITKQEFEAIGVPYEKRGKLTDEYIQAMKKIWTENLASFSGEHVKFREAQIFPKPRQKEIRILIGGGERGVSPRALRRVVELGDGWIPAYLTPEEMSNGISAIKQAAASAGRDPDHFYYDNEIFTALNNDSYVARENSEMSIRSNFATLEEGMKRSLVGTPKELIDKLKLYENEGVKLIELKFVYSSIPSLLEMMRLFADEVMPEFS